MTHRILLCLVFFLPAVCGQALIDRAEGSVRLLPADAAILEARQPRRDLNCRVKAIKPELGFDLGLHSGYEVSVPFEELAGSGNQLTAIFQVTPEDNQDQRAYFSQKWAVPPIAKNARGMATLRGEFVLGEGKYEVVWLMRDSVERYCSAIWHISADARSKDKQVELRMAHGSAAPEPAEPFGSEAPVKRDMAHSLHVLVLLHIASHASGAPGMQTKEMAAVVSILRSIAREPRIGSYSMTAFNLERQETVFRSENVPQMDFPALGKAIPRLQLGTIDARALRPDYSEISFLNGLLADEHPDALIFVGPKTSDESKFRGKFSDLVQPKCPVFYLPYEPYPDANPWRDLIGSVVKLWKGFEYTISSPRDLFLAWNEVMLRISTKEPAHGGPGRVATMTALAPKK